MTVDVAKFSQIFGQFGAPSTKIYNALKSSPLQL